MPKTEINEAVRKLRLALGDTQQQFAQRLGLAISSVVRYELTSEPGPAVLVQLANLAAERDLPEVAEPLNRALLNDLGVFALNVALRLRHKILKAKGEFDQLTGTIDPSSPEAQRLYTAGRALQEALDLIEDLGPELQ